MVDARRRFEGVVCCLTQFLGQEDRSCSPGISSRRLRFPGRALLPLIAFAACKPAISQTAIPASLFDVSAGAYTGLFRLPSADVIGEGLMNFGWSSGPAVRQTDRYISDVSRADNYEAKIGFLPGLEVGGSFLVAAPFNGQLRDRAAAVKYQLFNEARNGISLALGSTDVYGTSIRQTNYAVAEKNFGPLGLYAGVSDGLLKGVDEGVSYKVDPNVALMAEDAGGKGSVGLKMRVAQRFSGSVAVDTDHGLFVGLGYSFPLKSPNLLDSGASSTAGDSTAAGNFETRRSHLVEALSRLGAGRAEAIVEGGRLKVRYEDVEGRDPVATLGRALRLSVDAASDKDQQLDLIVRRFGFDLIILSVSVEKAKAFVQGYLSSKDFLAAATLQDPSSDDVQHIGTGQAHGSSPTALVTLAPSVNYSLGVKNDLPNKESVDAKAVVKLPAQLLAVATAETNFHDTLDNDQVVDKFGLGLYRTDELSDGFWSMIGIDHHPDEPVEGTLELSYSPSDNPFYITGSAGKPFAGTGDQAWRYAVEAGVATLRGSLTLWGRYERFEAGDTGGTLGLTRKFNQTWVILSAIRDHDSDIDPFARTSSFTKVGIDFQIPMPAIGATSGPVRIASSNVAGFGYHEIEHDVPVSGGAQVRSLLLSPDQDLQSRTQLTAWFVRMQIDQLRDAARGK